MNWKSCVRVSEVHEHIILYNSSMKLFNLLEMKMKSEYNQTENKREWEKIIITDK